MKILIASDSHDRWENLEKAITVATERGCEHFLFAGDFISPPGLEYFKNFSGHVHFVWGNNEGERMHMTRMIDARDNMTLHGDTMEEKIEGLNFFMNHFPDSAQNAALTRKYDICIFGHTHQYHEEKLENGTLLLNPGEVMGWRTGSATSMILDTETKSVEKITLL